MIAEYLQLSIQILTATCLLMTVIAGVIVSLRVKDSDKPQTTRAVVADKRSLGERIQEILTLPKNLNPHLKVDKSPEEEDYEIWFKDLDDDEKKKLLEDEDSMISGVG